MRIIKVLNLISVVLNIYVFYFFMILVFGLQDIMRNLYFRSSIIDPIILMLFNLILLAFVSIIYIINAKGLKSNIYFKLPFFVNIFLTITNIGYIIFVSFFVKDL